MKTLLALSADIADEYAAIMSHWSDVELVDGTNPNEVELVVYEPNQTLQDFSIFPNLKYVQSIWAGVDRLVGNTSLTVPVSRLVDNGLVEGMREYVLGHILADHIEIKRFEQATTWNDRWLPLARNKCVGILGFGTLGQAVGDAASALGFRVLGWSSSAKASPYENHFGDDGLNRVLAAADYVVLLLPHTADTEDIMNAARFAVMRKDAMLINAGRGALVDEAALIAALDHGTLRRAVLDVFKAEPLPENHVFWRREDILITPHIAAKSRTETAVEVIRENIDNYRAGRKLAFLVDFDRGY